jgi:hypothetical protein
MRPIILALLAALCGCSAAPAWTGTFAIEWTCAKSGGECDPLGVANADTLMISPDDSIEGWAALQFYAGPAFLDVVYGPVDEDGHRIEQNMAPGGEPEYVRLISVTIDGDSLSGEAHPCSDSLSRYTITGTRK